MTEEEYFRKNYPDSCYGDRPLSPYWDFFQDGVEFGERKSEKEIGDLEQKLEQTEKDLADYQFNYPSIKELSKENEELKGSLELYESGGCRATKVFECGVVKELKEQLTKKADTNHSLVEQMADLESKNAELKGLKDVATLIRANNDTVVTLMQLNNKLVSKSQQLTKATKLLTKWVELYKPKLEGYPITTIQEQTEQFLKEIK